MIGDGTLPFPIRLRHQLHHGPGQIGAGRDKGRLPNTKIRPRMSLYAAAVVSQKGS
jgi:hypothetical protein